MSLMDWIVLFVVAVIAGSLGQALSGYSLGGRLVAIAVGFVGALLGRWMGSALHLPEPVLIVIRGESFPLLWSIMGSETAAAVSPRRRMARRPRVGLTRG